MSTDLLNLPETALITAEEYALLPDEVLRSSELVRGRIVKMPRPNFAHGNVQVKVGTALENYATGTNSGRVTVESGVITEPDTIRGPDVAYWSYARLPLEATPKVFSDVAPDLIAEVISPSNSRREIARKIREYLAAGTTVVWVVDPDDRSVTVYRKPGDGRVIWDDAVIDCEDVLPGFSCLVANFFGAAR